MNLFKEIQAAIKTGKSDGITFNDIIGYEDVKDILQRAIDSDLAINILLDGPAGSAKTLLVMAVNEIYGDKALYINCAMTSAEMIFQKLNNAQKKIKVLILDEVDKLNKISQNKLYELLEKQETDLEYKSYQYHIKIPGLKVFAAGNGLPKLNKPFKSRFLIYQFPEYSDDEYTEIITYKLNEHGIGKDLIIPIIAHKLEIQDKDPRHVIEMIGLINKKKDTAETITKLLKTQEKYTQGSINYND